MKDFKKNCICNELRKNKTKRIDIAYFQEFNTGLYLVYGGIEASDEGSASCSIRFCPFCGREFKFDK